MTLRDCALQSTDIGAFNHGHGVVQRRLEKFLETFETANSFFKENSVFSAIFDESIYSVKYHRKKLFHVGNF